MLQLDEYGVFEVSDHNLVSLFSGGIDPLNPVCRINIPCSLITPGDINPLCGSNVPCGGPPHRNGYCPTDSNCYGNYPCGANPRCERP